MQIYFRLVYLKKLKIGLNQNNSKVMKNKIYYYKQYSNKIIQLFLEIFLKIIYSNMIWINKKML